MSADTPTPTHAPAGTEAEALIAAGAALARPGLVEDGGMYVVVPDGYRVQDMEKFLAAPSRARGTVRCETPEAFIAYYNRFCDTDASLVFACTEKFTAMGVLDWHRPQIETEHTGAPALAGFGEHRVVYEAPRSDEWKIWTEANGTAMPQADFSRFIEDNVKDIRTPDGADVLEVARQLEVKQKVEFASSLRLSDGQREFTYNETVDGTTRRGQLKVPEEFILGIPVFRAGELYAVTARLRYRIGGGQLSLWYDLLNPHEIERDAFGNIVTKIDEAVETDVLMATAG